MVEKSLPCIWGPHVYVQGDCRHRRWAWKEMTANPALIPAICSRLLPEQNQFKQAASPIHQLTTSSQNPSPTEEEGEKQKSLKSSSDGSNMALMLIPASFWPSSGCCCLARSPLGMQLWHRESPRWREKSRHMGYSTSVTTGTKDWPVKYL